MKKQPPSRLTREQLIAYSKGCERINLYLAWMDYIYVQLEMRGQNLPRQTIGKIVLQVGTDLNFEGMPMTIDIDDGEGGIGVIEP